MLGPIIIQCLVLVVPDDTMQRLISLVRAQQAEREAAEAATRDSVQESTGHQVVRQQVGAGGQGVSQQGQGVSHQEQRMSQQGQGVLQQVDAIPEVLQQGQGVLQQGSVAAGVLQRGQGVLRQGGVAEVMSQQGSTAGVSYQGSLSFSTLSTRYVFIINGITYIHCIGAHYRTCWCRKKKPSNVLQTADS